MARHDLPYSRLYPWADQPRRSFDDAAIARLAESIAVSGVLQNLVGRHPDPALAEREGLHDVEIVAGGSRLRAIGLLVERGAAIAGVPAFDYPIPVEVLFGLDDAAALELATIENLQRAELSPLEEADAFARLVDLGRSTEAIADKIAMTRRYVQLQVKLARNLAPAARESLAQGSITLAAARELCRVPAEAQEEALGSIRRQAWGFRTAAEIRQSLVEPMIPVERALFPLEAYTGAIVEVEDDADPDAPPRRLLADRKQALRLQLDAVEQRAAALRQGGATVHLGRNTPSWIGTEPNWREFEEDDEDDPRGETVIVLNEATFEVAEHSGWHREPETADQDDGADVADRRRAEREREELAARGGFSHGHLHDVHQLRAEALGRAVARSPHAAKALLLCAIAGVGPESTALEYVGIPMPDEIEPRMAEAFAALRARLDDVAGEPLPWDDDDTFRLAWYGSTQDESMAHQARALSVALSLDEQELDRAIALCVGACVQCRWVSAAPLGLDPATAVLVEAVDPMPELEAAFRIDGDWLAGLDAAQLVALAEDLGAPNPDEATLLGHPLPPGWLPPELPYGSQEEVLARLADRAAWREQCARDGERRSSECDGSTLTERQIVILQAISDAAVPQVVPPSVELLRDVTGHSTGAISQERKALRELGLLDEENLPTSLGRRLVGRAARRPAPAAEAAE